MTRIENSLPPEALNRWKADRQRQQQRIEEERAIMRESTRMSLGGKIFLSVWILACLAFIVWSVLNPPCME